MTCLTSLMKKDGEGVTGFKMPSKSDLEAAFDEADEDNGGTVDRDEFLLLYAKVKKGEVKGLGGGLFGAFRKMSVAGLAATAGIATAGSTNPEKPDKGFCVDFQVTLSEKGVEDFDAKMQKSYKDTASKALGVSASSVVIKSFEAGSVVVATRVVGLASEEAANVVSSKASNTKNDGLARALKYAAFGKAIVSSPTMCNPSMDALALTDDEKKRAKK